MNCRDIQVAADSFVMEELSPQKAGDVLHHLETCSSCRADLASRRQERVALRSAFETSKGLAPSPDLNARLLGHLRSESRLRVAAGQHSSLPAGAGRAPFIRYGLAAAASVLIAIGVTVTWSHGITAVVRGIAVAAVGDHRLCNVPFRLPERPVPLAEAAVRYGSIYSIYERVPASVIAIPSRPIRIVGRHVCEYAGRRFVHLVLQDRDQRLSVLITDVNRTVAPWIQPAVAVHRMDDVDEMTVAMFRTGRHLVFVTGPAAARDLEALATAIAQPLDEALAGL